MTTELVSVQNVEGSKVTPSTRSTPPARTVASTASAKESTSDRVNYGANTPPPFIPPHVLHAVLEHAPRTVLHGMGVPTGGLGRHQKRAQAGAHLLVQLLCFAAPVGLHIILWLPNDPSGT